MPPGSTILPTDGGRDQPNAADIARWWAYLITPDAEVEVRVLYRDGLPAIGRFTDGRAFQQAVRQSDTDPAVSGIYATLNPVRLDPNWPYPRNRLHRGGRAAGDADILVRRWLLVDLDPQRPAHTNATVAERRAAIVTAQQIGHALAQLGWPRPAQGLSGNGVHLVYPLADWPNTPEMTVFVREMLQILAQRFTTTTVNVDGSVFNASRISKIYGTTPRKGDPTSERPWWPARLLAVPDRQHPLTIHQARRIWAWIPTPESSHDLRPAAPEVEGAGHRVPTPDALLALLTTWQIPVRSDPHPYNEGVRIFVECPWQAEHSGYSGMSETAVFWNARTHAVGFRCQHEHCQSRTWSTICTMHAQSER
ncbi:primase P4-like protein [Sulfobacillus thermosulfidooxidans DSM 9293]|uniref:Primase P4-like protein n=1 Tax=Sulfobacillus thermosulfidooxidans (strain DSM 9293 / VKM B-1269 / AT-1) TaxID=929705 RepID=A0A1W1W726_SULTA|nr:hypothetical protein [Sulfobacillus thermosulfidooxidans]SMC02065.1 primase P4-like protein [Sulfobacillus thermosulfidooxidans DSM 9293]